MKQHKILLLIFLLMAYSCQEQLFDKELKILRHNTGDTLTKDFEVIKEYGKYFEEAQLIKDKRVSVTTFNQHIIRIYFSPITESEYQSIRGKIEKKLKKKAVHFIGKTHSGIKIIGDEFYWLDSISMNEFSIGVNKRADSIYSLSIFNEKIADSLSKLIIGNDLDEDIEIIVVEE